MISTENIVRYTKIVTLKKIIEQSDQIKVNPITISVSRDRLFHFH